MLKYLLKAAKDPSNITPLIAGILLGMGFSAGGLLTMLEDTQAIEVSQPKQVYSLLDLTDLYTEVKLNTSNISTMSNRMETHIESKTVELHGQ